MREERVAYARKKFRIIYKYTKKIFNMNEICKIYKNIINKTMQLHIYT